MELRQLRYFKTACELQNFSEAARVLHISQSTLSQQIKQLEEELDVLLFDRIGKKIVPTEAGITFLPFACKAIQDAEDGRQIIRDLKGIETGVLHIGATHSLAPLLVAAVNRFSESYPKVKIVVTIGTSTQMMECLKDNMFDFVLSFESEEWLEEFERMPLFSSRLFLVVHRTHPQAGLSSITLKRLEQLPLILPEKGFATRKRVEAICRRNGLNLNIGVEINDVHTILHTLPGGKWATLMSEAAVRGERELVCIPILCADETVSKAYLFWPQGIYRKQSALAFADCLRNLAQMESSNR